MKRSDDTGCLPVILVIIGIILLIPIITLGLIFVSLYYLVYKLNRKRKLRKVLCENEGQIFFLYKKYNQFNFQEYFESNNFEINCIEIEDDVFNDVFLFHLSRCAGTKGYPRLIKIENRKLLVKEHYNSFKYYVKRNKKPEDFFSLLKKSIKNLVNF